MTVMKKSVNSGLCKHRKVSETTHDFVFPEGTREAVKAWADHIENLQLQQVWYNTGQMNILIDARSAIDLPIRYLFEMLSDYNRGYPNLEAPHVKMAYLRSPDTVVLDIYQMMAELFDPPLTVQFFTDEDKARTWLKS